jgi:hypothetical protein
MSSKPLWLKAVHRIERAVGGPVEKAVRTDVYFDLVTKTTRVTGKVKRKVGGASTRVLHGINLPAGSDMKGMREQLSRMERRLNRLTEEVTELEGAPPKRASSKGARPKRPTSNGAPPKRATGKGARPKRTPVD